MFEVMPQKTKNELPPLKLGKETLGQRLARIRKERGITQVELSEKIGITQSLISAYETGRLRPNADMLARFSLTIKVSSDELLGLRKDATHAKTSPKVAKRMMKIESLSSGTQKAVLKIIDDLLVQSHA